MMGCVEIDHISVVGSVESLLTLGLFPAMTAGGGHGRVYLAGAYLEITEAGHSQAGLVGTAWYLRPRDTAACVTELRAWGVAMTDASVYRGRDGEWLDARVQAPALGASVPALTRRMSPTPRPWPPKPAVPNPSGAHGLRELHLAATDPARLVALLVLLGARYEAEDVVQFDDGVRVAAQPSRTVAGPVEIVLDRGLQPPLHLSLRG